MKPEKHEVSVVVNTAAITLLNKTNERIEELEKFIPNTDGDKRVSPWIKVSWEMELWLLKEQSDRINKWICNQDFDF